jgi:xanthine/uracil permease
MIALSQFNSLSAEQIADHRRKMAEKRRHRLHAKTRTKRQTHDQHIAFPAPVLGGATMVMFGCVVAAGIRIITQNPLTRRDDQHIASGERVLGNDPDPGRHHAAKHHHRSAPQHFLSHFPPMVGDLFGSAATSGGLVAIALNLVLPQLHAKTRTKRQTHDQHIASGERVLGNDPDPGRHHAARQIPAPVLGGATMVMFGCVVAAGIRIITQNPLTRQTSPS